jgi:hypothetical protein
MYLETILTVQPDIDRVPTFMVCLWLSSPLVGLGLLISFEVPWSHSFRHTTLRRTPLDEWSVRRRDLYRTTHKHSQETNIHATGGIRTHSHSKRSAKGPRLRRCGHRDWLLFLATVWEETLQLKKEIYFLGNICRRRLNHHWRTALPQGMMLINKHTVSLIESFI